MDDTTQNQPNQDQNTAQPQPTVQQPQQPSGGAHKEQAPLPSAAAEVVTPVEQAPQITPELREIGAEVTSETPKIPEDVAQHVQPAKESVPVATEPSGAVSLPSDDQKLPMTQLQAQTTIKQQKNNTSSSLVWFANIILRLLKKQHAEHVKGEDVIG